MGSFAYLFSSHPSSFHCFLEFRFKFKFNFNSNESMLRGTPLDFVDGDKTPVKVKQITNNGSHMGY